MALPKNRLLLCSLLPLLLLGTGCINENEKESPLTPTRRPETADFSADAAKAWLDLLTARIAAEALDPNDDGPEAARLIAYAGVTLYEAVVAGMPDHRSLGGQLNELGGSPGQPDADVHWPSAANAALADVLADLFAGFPASLMAFANLEASQAAQFAGEAKQADIERGIEHGEEVAEEIIDWIADDDYAQLNDNGCNYTVPVADGFWEPTPPGNIANPVEPCWGDLRPFALLFGAECAPLLHPPFSRVATSPFFLEAQEIHNQGNMGANLTVDQMAIATFWADGAGTPTPAGHWVNITGQVLEDEGEDLEVAAEAYAKVGVGLADALISSWKVKYVSNLLRPVTYIRGAPLNDATWLPFLIDTPPFPEFTSSHATQAAAAAELLTELFGEGFDFDNGARSFTSFTQAASEAADSSLFGGIQFRSALERGLEQGTCIARTILMEVQFRR